MRNTSRTLSHLFLVAAALIGGVGIARAQDDDEDEMEADAVVVQQPQMMGFVVNDQNFENTVFGNLRNAPGARAHLDTLLSLRLDEVDRYCKLTDAQAKKLRLAGRGDARRFFDRVDEKRKVFQVAKTDQVKYQQLYQELYQLQRTLQQGFFGEDSLFFKTIKATLDESQTARYADLIRDRQLYQFQVRLDLVVANLDNVAGLDASQRTQLLKLAHEVVKPPKKPSQYDATVVMLQIAKLPDTRLKAIFNDGQRRLVSPLFDNARNLEPMLSQNGYLPDEPAANKPR